MSMKSPNSEDSWAPATVTWILFKCFKIFWLHAIFHDAFGSRKTKHNVAHGYSYATSKEPIFANNLFLGHITGLEHWLVMKLCKNSAKNFSLQSLSL